MQVERTWSCHFEMEQARGHIASLYGFKNFEAMKPVLIYLENTASVTRLWWRKHEETKVR